MKTLILLFYMITAAIYDIKTKRLPLWLLLFFSVISIVYVFFSTKDSFNIFSFIPGIFMLIISFISNYSLGLGDSIFILSLGLLLSISDLICMILFSLFFVSFLGIFVFMKKRNKKQALPFVPFILAAFLLLTII